MNGKTVKPPFSATALQLARCLRRGMTDAERILWKYLRGGQLNGLKFRRQHPMQPYIVGFCCVEHALVIELDGAQHVTEHDARRTHYLQLQEWQVVRYWDNEVFLQTEDVVADLWNMIEARTLSQSNSPLPQGEGF